MLIGKRNNKPKTDTDCSEKEAVFKGLAKILETAGYVVRREQLKRGPGWQALSGACSSLGSSYVFVDRRLPKDEQIEFLAFKIRSLGLSAKPDLVKELPPKISELLQTPI